MPLPILAEHETRILCIDDNEKMLECLQAFLEPFGYSVRVTTSGREAIEIVAHWKADAVIVDYNMPAMNGHQVAREIKTIRSQVAIILLSGAPEIPEETLNIVDAFVDKNSVASRLLPTISDLLCRMQAPPQMSDMGQTESHSYDETWPVERPLNG
jgi:CheY-like chemotaxis protein